MVQQSNSLAYQLQVTAYEMWRNSNSALGHEEALNRRIVSTAYYAVFRLVVDEGLDLIFSTAPMKPHITQYYSGLFHHKLMVAIFNCYQNATNKKIIDIKEDKIFESELLYTTEMLEKVIQTNSSGKITFSHYQIKPDIVRLASLYPSLYDKRIKADYQTDNGSDYEIAFMQKVLDEMDECFILWEQLKKDNPPALIKLVWLMLHWEKLRK